MKVMVPPEEAMYHGASAFRERDELLGHCMA